MHYDHSFLLAKSLLVVGYMLSDFFNGAFLGIKSLSLPAEFSLGFCSFFPYTFLLPLPQLHVVPF